MQDPCLAGCRPFCPGAPKVVSSGLVLNTGRSMGMLPTHSLCNLVAVQSGHCQPDRALQRSFPEADLGNLATEDRNTATRRSENQVVMKRSAKRPNVHSASPQKSFS